MLPECQNKLGMNCTQFRRSLCKIFSIMNGFEVYYVVNEEKDSGNRFLVLRLSRTLIKTKKT
jgi:hypothetical protein